MAHLFFQSCLFFTITSQSFFLCKTFLTKQQTMKSKIYLHHIESYYMIMNQIADFFVSISCQMQIINHGTWFYKATWIDQSRVSIQKRGIWNRRNWFFKSHVYLKMLLSQFVWFFSTWQKALKKGEKRWQ